MPQDDQRFRNRIVEFIRVPAGDLDADPRNWRRHSDVQRESVSAMLETVGFVGAVVARRNHEGRLVIIDGHMRAGLDPTAEIPVLVVDVDDAEAGQLLATYDPIGVMADVDRDALGRLLGEIDGVIDPVLLDDIRSWGRVDEDDAGEPSGEHYGDHDGKMRQPSDYKPAEPGERTRFWVLEIPRDLHDDHVARVERLSAVLGKPGDAWAVVEAAVDHAESASNHAR